VCAAQDPHEMSARVGVGLISKHYCIVLTRLDSARLALSGTRMVG
jgi:hypothetical protein